MLSTVEDVKYCGGCSVLWRMLLSDPPISFFQQDEYEGQIEAADPCKIKGCTNEDEAASVTFNFSITSLVNKKEPLQIGDKVTIKLSCLRLLRFRPTRYRIKVCSVLEIPY